MQHPNAFIQIFNIIDRIFGGCFLISDILDGKFYQHDYFLRTVF